VIDQSGIFVNAQILFAEGTIDNKGIALVSIYPIIEKSTISKFPKEFEMANYPITALPFHQFTRPILRCVIKLPIKLNVTIFVVHLKSKSPLIPVQLRHDQKREAMGIAMSLTQRAAEAAALRCIIVEERMKNPSQPIIIVGDLNDTLNSVTTSLITGHMPWKTLPRDKRDAIWNMLLYSATETQARKSHRDIFYSHIHNGRYDLLDHVLISKEFYHLFDGHIGKVQCVQNFNDHLRDETLVEPSEPKVEGSSDHGQIAVQIKVHEEFIKAGAIKTVAIPEKKLHFKRIDETL